MRKKLKNLKRIVKRQRVDSSAYIAEAAESAPRITNQTVAEHREEVLSSARKYILPLAHSRRQIITITTTLVVVGVVAFFTYCALALYKLNSDSRFTYTITQVIPFPVARAGGRFVAYENYLFELRRFEHYYKSQQKTNFDDKNGKDQLVAYRKQALDSVILNAYVKQLAEKHNITVSDSEVTQAVDLMRAQNRLGNNDKVFEAVLRDYWGWSVTDFRRSLHDELLAQKVVSTLDTDAHKRVQTALDAIKAGGDFAALAKQHSEDPDTKNNGGEYGYPIDRTTRSVSADVVDALYRLKPGQVSEIVDDGSSLEILKCIDVNSDKIRAAHISIRFKDINTYVDDLKEHDKSQSYIKV